MIDKVAFTGREGMLVNAENMAAKAVNKEAEKFVLSSSVLPDITKISEAVYTSPFAPVLDNAGKLLNKLV